MKKLVSLAILILFWSPCLAIGAVSIPFSDDFESYTVGQSLPSPWANGLGGPGIVTTAQAHSGNKSVTPVNTFASCVLDLGTNYTDFLQYEGWFHRPSEGGGALIGFHEQFSNMLPAFNAVRMGSDGKVYFESADKDTGFQIVIASGIAAGWHHVKVQLNFDDLLGSVWFDGNHVLDSVPISPKEWVVYGSYGAGPLIHIGFSHYAGGPVYFDDFVVSKQPLLVALDIKPGSCPNPLDVKKKDDLPAAILGSADLDVSEIDIASLRLEDVAPHKSSFEDVATPFEPLTGKEDCFEDCTTEKKDGFVDLTLKFDPQAVLAALGEVVNKECLVLTLTGNLQDGTPIVGEDVVIIRKE